MIKVKSNVKQVANMLNKYQRRQIPYATARGLTKTVKGAQRTIINDLTNRMTKTRKWALKQQPTGVKITSAKKDNLTAAVYTRVHFAENQEEGGTKFPYKGRALAVPTARVPKSRRKSGGARIMMKQKKTFANRRGIYRKKGGKKNPSIEKLFTFFVVRQDTPANEFQADCGTVLCPQVSVSLHAVAS
jgi:hypothetical protein